MLRWLEKLRSLGTKEEKSIANRSTDGANVSLQRGNAYLDQGLLLEAEACYRQAIALDAGSALAYVNLGFVLLEQERPLDACESLRKALKISPENVDAHYMLGTIESSRGNQDQAICHFHDTVAIKPDFEFALRDLSRILIESGRMDEARSTLEAGLSVNPSSPEIVCYMGNLNIEARGYERALECFQQALNLAPDHVAAISGMGLAYRGLGQTQKAVAIFSKALEINARDHELHYNFGLLLSQLGKYDEAIQHYRRAISIKLEFPEAWNSLGFALMEQARLADAAESCRQALRFRPLFAEAHSNLGVVLEKQESFAEAEKHLRQALALKPNLAVSHNNLAMLLKDQGKIDEAIVGFRQAASLLPDNIDIQLGLSSALLSGGYLDETIDVLQQALSKHPKSLKPLNNLLYVMTYHDRYSSKEYVEIARDFGRMLSSRVPFLLEFPKTLLDPDVGPLRVGIVSGDLRNHPVGFFLENVLSHLNPERIELVAYPTNSMENELTARIKHRFSKWHPIVDLSDECAAKLVRDDGIHLLVDLSGHTGHNRLPLFSLKPAPVQATWLGYWASTGVAEIDYILVDPISVPESDQAQFTETVWYLPDTRLCPSPLDGRLPIAPLPAQAIGGITFGCFQQLTKINDNVLATWGRIFGALPYARLRIQDKRLISPVIREQLLQRLKRIGIVAERVSLHGHSSRDEYLASHADVDIILDTFPYPGGTTTCEALWMGVPTITLAGNSLLSRQGASLLGCCGLEEWVAHDMDEYVNLAIYHASDIERLATMRLGLRKRALASPLFDAQRFARNLELAFFGMWRSKMASLSSPHAQC